MLGLLKVFIADPTRISNEHAHTTAWSAHTDKTGPTDVPRSFRDVLEERDKEQRGKRSPLSKCEFHVRYCHYIEAGRWLQQAEDLPVTLFFFVFFWAALGHMEIPGLGVELELQLQQRGI